MKSPHFMGVLLWLVVTGTAVPSFAQTSARAESSSAATVRVAGQVLDSQNAVPLPGVTVELVGSDTVAYTDVDGRYVLDVPAGAHKIRVILDGYEEQVLNVEASDGAPVDVDVSLDMAGFAEEVTVEADVVEGSMSSAETLLTERRRAPVISDNLGSTEMRQNADSNAASGMQRVTGLSVVDGQYVFVRGLGERYSATTLNGASLPTTEPDRRVVPLDLFPAGLIDSVRVTKSFSPDQPGDFAGGVVEIEPLSLPSRAVFDGSFTIGFNSQTTGETGLGYAGGDNDFLGYGKGPRELPGGFPTETLVRRGGIFTPDVGFLREDLEPLGESFDNIWEARPRDSRPEQTYNLVYGNRFGRLGIVASFTQGYDEQFTDDEIQRFFRVGENDELSTFSDYEFRTSTLNARTGAVGNVAWQFTPNHRLGVNNLYTHTGKDETRIYEGFNSDIDTTVRDTRLFWIEEGLLTNQAIGEHFFSGLSNSRVDWRVAYARADRDEPDLRQTLYELQAGEFLLADESQSGFRMFNTLDDESIDVALNWSVYMTTWANQPMMIKFGPSFVHRERDFQSRRFRFIPLDVTFSADRALSPEELFTPANIGPEDSWEIREETRPTDAYGAEQDVFGGYGMVDVPLSNQLRLVGGVRVERFEQTVDTFDPFSVITEVVRGEIDTTDVLPSVNLIYATTPSSNLRVGFSQTVNRPEFREVAPFEFTDVVGGRAVVGNPDLQRALIRNVDVRWELFPGAEEVIAASVFFKQFEDPIERIVEPTAQLRTSYTNADSARNFGVELEARKALTPWLLAGANYTFVDSEIELTEAAQQVQTSLSRPLAGTSRHLFNAIGEVRFAERSSLRVLYNFFGDRISDIGSEGLPDIIQEDRGALDVVLSYGLGRALNLRVAGLNLIDDPFEFSQGSELQRSYSIGRTFSVALGFSAF